MKKGICDIKTSRLAYRLYGELSNPFIIVETAMGASSAEWWHLAEKWSEQFCILLYDRAGYGLSTGSKLTRSPVNIANELNELLNTLGVHKQAIMVGHSLGGVYAQQFVRLFPEKVCAIILLDPASANNCSLKQNLNKKEYDQSGIDKSANLKLGLVISSLRLGFLLVPILKKAPPFYYFNSFSKEAEDCILRNLMQPKLYKSAIVEYQYLESGDEIETLREKNNFPDIPLFLICHDPNIMIAEIETFGGADKTTATKIDEMWIALMKEYLQFSGKSTYAQAKNSGHQIHLSAPDAIWDALCNIHHILETCN